MDQHRPAPASARPGRQGRPRAAEARRRAARPRAEAPPPLPRRRRSSVDPERVLVRAIDPTAAPLPRRPRPPAPGRPQTRTSAAPRARLHAPSTAPPASREGAPPTRRPLPPRPGTPAAPPRARIAAPAPRPATTAPPVPAAPPAPATPPASTPSPSRAAPASRLGLLVGLLVAALTAFVYLWRLDRTGLIPDELVYLTVGERYLRGDTSLNLEHPPLAKLLFGVPQLLSDVPLAGRWVAAAAGCLLTLCVFLLGRRLAGTAAGAAAALVWLAVPHGLQDGSDGWPVPLLDRFAMLDVVATAFATASVVVALRWRETRGWGAAVGAGALLGAAVASKFSGGLVAPAVVVVAVAAVAAGPARGRAALQVGTGVLAAAGAAALPYAAFGREGPSAAVAAVEMQLAHADSGHTVLVAGELYERAPWWSHLWYAWDGDGPVVTVALLVAVVAGLLATVVGRGVPGGRRVDVLVVLVAGLAPLAVLSASPVALPFYRFLWLPPTAVLAGVGIAAAGRAAATRRPLRPGPRAARVVLAAPVLAAAVALAATGASTLARLATLQPTGYAAAAAVARDVGGPDATIAMRGYPELLSAYLPGARVLPEVPETGADVVVLDPSALVRLPAPELVAAARAQGLVPVGTGGLTVWVPPAHAVRLELTR